MTFRRSVSRLLVLLLLLVLVAPFGAMAATNVQGIRIQYEGIDPLSPEQMTLLTAVEGMDYLLTYQDEARTQLWIQLLSQEIPMDRVLLFITTAQDMMMPAEYPLTETMPIIGEASEFMADPGLKAEAWLNMMGTEMMPKVLYIDQPDVVMPESVQVVMSYEPMPVVAPLGDGYGDITDPWGDDQGDALYGDGVQSGDDAWGDDLSGYQDVPDASGQAGDGAAVVPPNDEIRAAMNAPITDTQAAGEIGADTQQGLDEASALSASLGAAVDTLRAPAIQDVDDQELPEGHGEYGRVKEDNAPFYLEMGSVDAINVEPDLFLEANTVYRYFEDELYTSEKDASGKRWIPVELVERPLKEKGYLKLDDAAFMDAIDEQAYIATIDNKQKMPQLDSDFARPKEGGAILFTDSGQEVRLERTDVVRYDRAAANYYNDNQSGLIWLHVTVPETGETGTILMDSLSFMTPLEERDYAAQVEAAEKAAQQAAEEEAARQQAAAEEAAKQQAAEEEAARQQAAGVSNETTSTTPEEPGAGATETNPKPEMPDVERHAWVNTNSVKVRSRPSPASTVSYFTVKKNDVVIATDVRESESGDLWYYAVRIIEGTNKGKTGYIQSDLLTLMTEEEEANYLIDHPAEVTKEPTAKPDPTQTATPVPEAPAQQSSGYMRVNVTYAPLTSWADLGASVIAVLSQGEVVYVQGQTYDAVGNVWSRAQQLASGSPWGYVQHKYLTQMSPAEVAQYFATPRPTPAAVPTYSPTAFSGYGILTTNSVNFRSSASSANNNNVLRQLTQGTIVRIISETASGGYTWYQCESNGTTGYIRSDVMAPLSIQDYLSLSKSPSYSQNGNIITPTATANIGSPGASTWSTPKAGALSTITFVTLPPASTSSPDPSASADASGSPDPNASPEATDETGAAAALSPSPDPSASADAEYPTEASSGFSAGSVLAALGTIGVLGAGGVYGYSIYNKNRKKLELEQAAELAGEAGEGAGATDALDALTDGEMPAVRRPVPPADSAGTAAGVTGAGALGGLAANKAKQDQQQGAYKPGQPNPYARPAGEERPKASTQDVASPMPRAQVDGRPVGAAQANPYARPQGQQPAQQRPAATPPGQAKQPGATGAPPTQQSQATRPAQQQATPPAQGTQQRSGMPIAPPPVSPDAQATAGAEEAPRRRRRRQSIEGQNSDTNDNT